MTPSHTAVRRITHLFHFIRLSYRSLYISDDYTIRGQQSHLNIGQYIHEGLTQPPLFTERRLNPGEAKTKLAFLSFLSGTNVSIGQAYGMIESCVTISFPRLDMKVCTLGSSGVLLPDVTAKVIKEDGTVAGFGEQGQLYVKAPSLALGYYQNEAAWVLSPTSTISTQCVSICRTKETFIDGWLRTRDEVIINKDYETFIVDQRKEIGLFSFPILHSYFELNSSSCRA